MKNRIKVLNIITSLDPKFGGPSTGTIDSAIALSNQGFKIDILTSDVKNSGFVKSKKIKVINKGPPFGNYALNFKLYNWLFRHRDNYDAFVIHGVWEFNTLVARILLKKKYFVYSHGQLDPFFSLNLIKKIKKIIYWYLIEKKNLMSSRSLLVTTENEKRLLSNTFVNTSKITKTIVGYGINQPKFNKTRTLKYFYKKFPNLKNKKFLLFLGRFHEKKGCDILIKAIKKLSDQNIHIKVLLAGPNNEYKKKLMNLSNNYGLKNNIFWSDIILGNLKWGAISASVGMVLSSHSENFGVALVESLSCSKPVLTTNKVNIYKEILNFNAGFISKDNINSFAKILKKYNNLNSSDLKKLSNNSLKCFKKNFDLSTNMSILTSLLKKNIEH